MADFCNQCAEKCLGVPGEPPIPGDFEGVTTEEMVARGLYVEVLCEGCGFCQVDPQGDCISLTCDEEHGKTTP